MTLIWAPNSALKPRGCSELTPVGPVAPKIAGRFKRSSKVLNPDVCQAVQVPVVWSILPIQVNFSILNLAFFTPNKGAKADDEAKIPISVPSFLAEL